MAAQAAARLEQFLAVPSISWLLHDGPVGQSGLPQIRRNRFNLVVAQPEIRHPRSRPEIRRLLQPHRNPVLVEFQPDILQIRPNLLHVLQQALRRPVQLHDPQIQFAVRHPQRHRLVVQTVRFLIRLCRIGLLHQERGLLQVIFLLRLHLLDLLRDGVDIFRFLVVAFVSMAARASALPEKVLPLGQRPAHIAAHQHHVSGVASLASCLDIRLRKHRPQPMFIIPVRFLHAGRSAPISLVARSASELVRVMRPQKLRLGMAGKSVCILVWLPALRRHRRRRQFDRLADSHVARLASIHNVGVRHIDLHDHRIPRLGLILQAFDLSRREIHHVLGDVAVQLRLPLADRFDHIAQLRAERRTLRFQLVVSLFELRKGIARLAAVRILDDRRFLFVLFQIFEFALFR